MIKLKYLSVGLFNAGSLSTKHDEFKAAVSHLQPDIMAINETWLREGDDGLAPVLPGYRLRHTPRPKIVHGGRGGGVGFYIKRGISARTCAHPVSSVEQYWICLSVNSLKIVIGTAYRPPWQDINIFLDSLTDSCMAFSPFDRIILLGDFNINLMDAKDNKSKLFSTFLDYSKLEQCIQDPTHFTSHSETLIDLICTDAHVRNAKVNHIPELGNHAIVSVELNLKITKPSPRSVTYRPLNDILLNYFFEDLNQVDWDFINSLPNVNEMVSEFNANIAYLFDLHAPEKRITIREYLPPWLTDTVSDMIRTRNRAFKRYKNTGLDSHKAFYKQLKSSVVSAIFSEKKAYFEQHINTHLKNPKKLWKNLKSNILSDTAHRELPESLTDPDLLNTHFLNVPGDNTVTISTFSYYEFNKLNTSVFTLVPVDQDAVASTIRTLRSGALGFDRISLQMVSLTLPYTLCAVTEIINKSISSSTFPDTWKTAIIRPIPKTSCPVSFKDLRPISILPYLSKILEKVVYSQLHRYIESNELLPVLQSGFRKSRSTTTALLNVVDDILHAQDGGMGTILVLLDYSRAFDSINIPLLLSKLTFFGFDAGTVNWFRSYLCLRSQMVEIVRNDGSKTFSKCCPVTRGVPQGSILGPLLYIIYSSDIINSIKHCKFHLYADDLQLYFHFKPSDTEASIRKINEDLSRICAWSNDNCLVLNPIKSKFLLLGTKKQILEIVSNGVDIKIMGESMERVSEARNLGLLLDAHLRFENHIMEAVRNCFYRLKLLYRIRSFLSHNLRIRLCESLVLSKLNYADSVYGPRLYSRTERLIQRVQNACARFCFNTQPRDHITPYLNNSNLLKMCSRRNLHLACLIFGIVNNKLPEYLFNKLLWVHADSRYSNRAPVARLLTPRHKSIAFRGSFRFAASRCWNDIPPPIRALKSSNNFKEKLKLHYLLQQKSV